VITAPGPVCLPNDSREGFGVRVDASAQAIATERRHCRPTGGHRARIVARIWFSNCGLCREADASQVQAPRKQSERGRRNPQCRCRERRQAAGAASAAWKRDRIMGWHAEGQQDVIVVAGG
jgi:hypothetical protein